MLVLMRGGSRISTGSYISMVISL